jgi:tetratricopeptide (TPR) repeat protein
MSPPLFLTNKNQMQTQPKIEKQRNTHWTTHHPPEVETRFEEYYEAVHLMDYDPKKAEKIFKKIIADCGNGHLDAITHLGLLYIDTGKIKEGNALITRAHEIAVDAFPGDFAAGIDKLSWDIMENRPILRAFQCYGLERVKEHRYDLAMQEFQFLQKINPEDDQGIRYLLLECLLQYEKPEDILLLDEFYPDDYSVEFKYGKVLALLMLKKKAEAGRQLEKAIEAFPRVAEELAKTNHVFPADEFKHQFGKDGEGYPLGSRQQAYDYWQSTQKFWDRVTNIKEFITKVEVNSAYNELVWVNPRA